MTQVYVGERDVVLVSGADAETYLQGQISQDLSSVALGESAWSLILQPQGKVDAWFRITRASDRFVLDVDAGLRGGAARSTEAASCFESKVEVELETWALHAYDGRRSTVSRCRGIGCCALG